MSPRTPFTSIGAALLALIVIPALIWSCTSSKGARPHTPSPGEARYGECVILDPIVEGNLAVYPVIHPGAPEVDILTFDEAVENGLVTVTERGGGTGQEVQSRQIAVNENRGTGSAGQPPAPQGEQTLVQTDDSNDAVQIAVQTEGGSATVNTLVIENRGDKPVFIMAGEIVKGGKQDRTIAQDSIIPPKSGPVDINVFCVEHGRWQGAGAAFGSAKVCADNSIRRNALVKKSQSDVWAAVAEKNEEVASAASATWLGASSGGHDARASRAGVEVSADPVLANEQSAIAFGSRAASATNSGVSEDMNLINPQDLSAMVQDFAPTGTYLAGADNPEVQKRLDARIRRLLNDLAWNKHVTGFVVAQNGTVVGADLFANPTICRKMQEKLLKSYVYDAETTASAAAGKAPTCGDVSRLLNDVAAGKATIERASKFGHNRANENDVAAIFTLQADEKGVKLHECLQKK